MSAALIAQLQKMPTEDVEKVLSLMVSKVQQIKFALATETDPESRLALIDKLKRIRAKYDYVEQELAIRLVVPQETVTGLVDVAKLSEIEDAINASISIIGAVGTL